MRRWILSAVASEWLLLAPQPARVAHGLAAVGIGAPVSYAQGSLDNPTQPGDAFPTGPFSGGTD
ncbi:MAG TPA: hypothetical protein VII06_00010 [Chloroflexota bacterium]|jgi:hypothetical protein